MSLLDISISRSLLSLNPSVLPQHTLCVRISEFLVLQKYFHRLTTKSYYFAFDYEPKHIVLILAHLLSIKTMDRYKVKSIVRWVQLQLNCWPIVGSSAYIPLLSASASWSHDKFPFYTRLPWHNTNVITLYVCYNLLLISTSFVFTLLFRYTERENFGTLSTIFMMTYR